MVQDNSYSYLHYVVEGIGAAAAQAYLKVQVRSGGTAGGAHIGYTLAAFDTVASRYQELGVVSVERFQTAAVVNNYVITIAASVPARHLNNAFFSRVNGRAVGAGDVHAAVAPGIVLGDAPGVGGPEQTS